MDERSTIQPHTGVSPRAVRRARILLVGLIASALFFVAISLSPLKSGFADAPDRGPGDIPLYHAEVARLRAGESYYDAAGAELRERGYPTTSVFNWRMPLPVWLLGQWPESVPVTVLLGSLAVALLLASFVLLCECAGAATALFGAFLLMGTLVPCFLGDLAVMSELWAGVLIALSAVLLVLERSKAGVIAGLAALFVRELAAPYCGLCLLLALRERRFREATGWGVGMLAFGVFFALHATQVWSHIGPHEPKHHDSWLRLGGAAFLISTAQMNAYLLLLPQWITAIYLACALAGAVAWRSGRQQVIGLTVVMYAIAFCIVGHDYNQYWGSLMAPLMALSASRAPAELARLWRVARCNHPLPRPSVAVSH